MSVLHTSASLEKVMCELAHQLGDSVMEKMVSDIRGPEDRISKLLRVHLRIKMGSDDEDHLGVRVEEVANADFEKDKDRLLKNVRADTVKFCDNLLEGCMKEMRFLRDALKKNHGAVYCSVCHSDMHPKRALKCGACKTPYCSRACQIRDWKHNNHRTMCGCLSRLDPDLKAI